MPSLPSILGRLVFTIGMLPAAFSASFAAPSAQEEGAEHKKPEAEELEEERSVTQHSVVIDGEVVPYTATAGTYYLAEEDGKKKASIFYIAYVRDGVEDVGSRPITFSFNGGPGSSSVWLHLGVFGPRRVPMEPDGEQPAPPYSLVPNEHSLLDVTDLVFIDPVTTGYSRAVPGEDDSQFHGVREDVESVAEFIRLYASRERRWTSPKCLAGESYGTTRAAELARYLQDRHGMYLNGVVLVSAILDFQTARFDVGNDLPYMLFLPTYTATAWYHRKLGADLQQDLGRAIEAAKAFALGEYASALLQGSTLPEAKEQAVAEELARLTGLSVDFVRRANLRVSISRFVKELAREDRRTVGRLDSRFLGVDRDAAGEGYEFDPSYAAIQGAYTALLNDYVRTELGYESDLPYEILTGRVRPWSYGDAENRYLNVAESLRRAMTQNPHLRTFVASGYYDLATPFFATDYTMAHLGLEGDLADHVEIHYYESGHMMYIHMPSLADLKADLAAFYDELTP